MSYYSPQVQVGYAPPQASTAHIVIAWIVAVFTGFYMLPWAIAATRSKQNVGSVAMVNLFLGWTLVGWVVALVMACSAHPLPPSVLVNNTTQVSFGAPALGWGPAYPVQQYPAYDYRTQQYPVVQEPYGVSPQPPLHPAPQQYYPQAIPPRPYDPGYEPTRILPTHSSSATEVTQPIEPWSRAADPYDPRQQ